MAALLSFHFAALARGAGWSPLRGRGGTAAGARCRHIGRRGKSRSIACRRRPGRRCHERPWRRTGMPAPAGIARILSAADTFQGIGSPLERRARRDVGARPVIAKFRSCPARYGRAAIAAIETGSRSRHSTAEFAPHIGRCRRTNELLTHARVAIGHAAAVVRIVTPHIARQQRPAIHIAIIEAVEVDHAPVAEVPIHAAEEKPDADADA